MLVRSGWGERRVAMQQSADFREWSEPELLLEPDPLDPPQAQFYGMPAFPYEQNYVGFLWFFTARPPTGSAATTSSGAASTRSLLIAWTGIISNGACGLLSSR